MGQSPTRGRSTRAGLLVVAFLRRDYERFIAGFFGAAFNEPHSTKPIEDTIGWARETTPDVIAAGAAEFDHGLIEPRLG